MKVKYEFIPGLMNNLNIVFNYFCKDAHQAIFLSSATIFIKVNCTRNEKKNINYDILILVMKSVAINNIFVYKLSHPQSPGQFSKEDLARALLLFFVHEFAHLAQLAVTMGGCKYLFFAGGFTNMPLVRSLMASEMAKRIITDGVMSGKVIEIEALPCCSMVLKLFG